MPALWKYWLARCLTSSRRAFSIGFSMKFLIETAAQIVPKTMRGMAFGSLRLRPLGPIFSERKRKAVTHGWFKQLLIACGGLA